LLISRTDYATVSVKELKQKVNEYQKWVVGSLIVTTLLTAVNLYLTNHQQELTKTQLKVERQKILPNTQEDSLELTPKIPAHQTISQKHP
jgi:hypothetical protein